MKYKVYHAILLAVLLNQACSPKQKEMIKEKGGIPDSVVKTLSTSRAETGDTEGYIKLNGKIEPDEARQVKVFTLVSGKVQSVNVELGDFVQKGQVLAVMKSSEVASISNAVDVAAADMASAEKNLASVKELYAGNLATEQDYTNAKSAYTKAVSEMKRAKQVAAISGGESSEYIIKAPISGYVIDKNVTNNSEVRTDNSSELFAIADLSTVWIMANVYEADMNSVQLNDVVNVNTLSNPDKTYAGKIDKIYSILDPETRTMKVRISMPNPGNELKPEMFAAVKVLGRSPSRGIIIPSKAIVMDNSKNYVVLKKGNDLKIQPIELINRVDGKAYVSGLNEGDEVVTKSQVFLFQALNNN